MFYFYTVQSWFCNQVITLELCCRFISTSETLARWLALATPHIVAGDVSAEAFLGKPAMSLIALGDALRYLAFGAVKSPQACFP